MINLTLYQVSINVYSRKMESYPSLLVPSPLNSHNVLHEVQSEVVIVKVALEGGDESSHVPLHGQEVAHHHVQGVVGEDVLGVGVALGLHEVQEGVQGKFLQWCGV